MTEYKNAVDEIKGTTLNLTCMTIDNTPVSSTMIELYQIAKINENGELELTEQFKNLPIFNMISDNYVGDINDLNAEEKYNMTLRELNKYIPSDVLSYLGQSNSGLLKKGYYIKQTLVVEENIERIIPTLTGYTDNSRESTI